jgi:simple sugar transport system ATP-binding protein
MPVVEMRGVTKRFGTLVANDAIDLDVEANEIQALLGENGAGKTTLMKILYGMYQPDEGEILIEGQRVQLKSPADAIARGVGFVSQHFSLVPTFTVAENVVLGYEGGRLLNRDQTNRTVADLAQSYGFALSPTALVRDLSVGEQQRVEILKALYRRCRFLILDEPTAVLTPTDTEKLFESLRDLQQKHLSVVIITHKLEEAMAISQRVTVLRHGTVVGRERTAATSPTALARLMVGRNTVAIARNTDHHSERTVVLQVEGLKLTDRRSIPVLRDVSFSIHAGEVVGIAGVAGNGQSELVNILQGMLQPDAGAVCVNGQHMQLGDPRLFYRAKVGRIPEDRLKGIVGDLTVAHNLALEHIGDFTRSGYLNHRQIHESAARLIQDFQIKAKPDDLARTLSGGNIQKIILARTLSQRPVALIAAQPTRGLDVGATEYVHQKLLEQKERGAAILLVSEDLDETLLLSDRILVIYEGQIVAEFSAEKADIHEIGLLMAGGQGRVEAQT